MREYVKHISHQHIFLGLICLALVSIIFSKFLLSLSMIGMLLLSFVHVDSLLPFRVHKRTDWQKNISETYIKKPWAFIGIIFVVSLVSALWSSDLSIWLDAVRINLPFIILPYVFYSQEKISQNIYQGIHLIWIAICMLGALLVIGNYILDFEAITASIKQGQAIPTPFSRPNFSVLMAFGLLISLYLNLDSNIKMRKALRYLLVFCSVFLLVFLHILSVRSGLLVAYLGIGFLGILCLTKTKRYLLGLGLVTLVFCIPVVSYFTIPSFKNKIGYSVYDLKQFNSDKGTTYSDSERIYSIHAGWHVFKKYPILGSGIGDLRSECMKYYRSEEIRMLKFKYPHNQFIYMVAAYGLAGLILFLVSIYGPLFVDQNYKNIYLLLLYISMTGLFLVESPLGRANMLAFYITFVSLGIMREKNKRKLS